MTRPARGDLGYRSTVWISELHSAEFGADISSPIKSGFAGIITGFAMVKSLRVFAPRSSGREINERTAVDFRRGNISRR
ncbi:hypothetical protein [Ruminococcus albus]|uniref:hypothetical protein n=1 Tax=Ruminococcus albus TaxID=1264 RepID=UPI0009430939|nr:hypothetical protein [Ruminococcus albus]